MKPPLMDNRVFIRCSTRVKDALEAVAQHIGLSLSDWARVALMAEARKYSKEHGFPDPFADEEVNEDPEGVNVDGCSRRDPKG